MKRLSVLQVGVGQVGSELIRIIGAQHLAITKQYGVDLQLMGVFRSSGGCFDVEGLGWREQLDYSFSPNLQVIECLSKVTLPFILVDTTASEATVHLMERVIGLGGWVVTSNKKPLTCSQGIFDLLEQSKRVCFETTVGSALPVIATLKNLLATGDEVSEIRGALSGTLGYIFSELDRGEMFSAVVNQARKAGFTEPDPRDDLSGLDVARKVLILARICGHTMELSDIEFTPLYPKEMSELPLENFLTRIETSDGDYRRRFAQAKDLGKCWRYVATISPNRCSVGMQLVEKNSEFGNLHGTDNLIVIHSKRYRDRPIVIKGPGAGVGITAAGVLAEMLSILPIIKKEF